MGFEAWQSRTGDHCDCERRGNASPPTDMGMDAPLVAKDERSKSSPKLPNSANENKMAREGEKRISGQARHAVGGV